MSSVKCSVLPNHDPLGVSQISTLVLLIHQVRSLRPALSSDAPEQLLINRLNHVLSYSTEVLFGCVWRHLPRWNPLMPRRCVHPRIYSQRVLRIMQHHRLFHFLLNLVESQVPPHSPIDVLVLRRRTLFGLVLDHVFLALVLCLFNGYCGPTYQGLVRATCVVYAPIQKSIVVVVISLLSLLFSPILRRLQGLYVH